MKIIKFFVISAISLFIFIGIFIYFSLLVLLPNALNSKENISGIENFLYERTGLRVVFNNLKFSSDAKLNLKLCADKITVFNRDYAKTATIDNFKLNADTKRLLLKSVEATNIDIDGEELQKCLKKGGNKKNISYTKLPEIKIDSLLYKFKNNFVYIKDLHLKDSIGRFNAEIKTPGLKNNIIAGQNGNLIFNDNSVYAKNFDIIFGQNILNINGKLYDNNGNVNFSLTGENLPVYDIEKSLLFYQKSQDPAKKFIENFKNYSGTLDINLNVKKEGIFGKCIAKNLKANAIWFDIPIYFKEAVFDFNGNSITSLAQGLLGNENVTHELDVINIGTPQKEVFGRVKSHLSDNFKYVPNLTILNGADANLIYNIKNKLINVQYILDLNENADLLYKDAYLGLRNKHRKFDVRTLKDGNNLYITEYNYLVSKNNGFDKILSGNGHLFKANGHFKPDFVTFKTNGYAPVSVTGSFKKYLNGGEFNGDLKYDFIKEKLSGNFEVSDTRFKDFYINSAKINAGKNVLIKGYGLYFGELFTCDIKLDNDFSDSNIIVEDLNLFLDKFVIKRTKNKLNKNIDISSKVKSTDITINNWDITLNEIRKGRIVLNNIKLHGNLKNNIFRFSMPELSFAKGFLSAEGKYNFNDNSSVIDFKANNIDSNEVADVIFDLPNQVEGIADATLKVKTLDKLADIKANAWFSINDGFLPELGSTEFMFMKSKVKVADVINIDFSKKKALMSDIEGTFEINNSKIKNVNLTSKQKFMSLFIEGDYDVQEKYADLQLYGKYDKLAPKGIKILFVPLNWVLKAVFRQENTIYLYKEKLDKIPSIEAKKENEKFFRVNLKGNLERKDKLNVELKGIK